MSQPFELRLVGAADLDLLARIDPRLADEPARRRHVAEVIGTGMSWAAVVEETLVGFAVVSRHFYGFPFVELLVVTQSARRGGVGSALMARCEADHDADRIFTSTNESNEPMRRLLAKADWSVSGLIENLDPGDPELVFVKFRT
jgi:GNAT superfamily N-acetyltransferase